MAATEPMYRVERMKEMIDYREKAIVSRTIISKRAGTVTLFAFDAGQGLSEHTAPFDAFIYVLEGVTEVTISGEPRRMIEGDMIVMPANAPHELKALKQLKMLLVMIKT